MSNPQIKPMKGTREYTCKQSKYEIAAKLPMRSVILGPSGSGKTILLQSMITDIYAGCFERIYVFSPSIDVDAAWRPVKKYIESCKIEDNKEDPLYYDHYDPEALTRIIAQQHKLVQYMKDKKYDKIYNILIIVDDFSDDAQFSRHSSILWSLYTRGRHNHISTICSIQKWKSLANIVRVNCTEIYVYRMRNQNDLESLLEELSALYDKQTLLQIYNIATSDPYSFLYINLMAKKKEEMFFLRFDKALIPE